jgi:peroxiredoxin (alkyl hydroperoxide reductase subunit C)
VAASVDSHFTHLAWVNTPRKDGGLGSLSIPLLSDMTHKISKDYGVYLSDVGHSLRYYLLILMMTNYYFLHLFSEDYLS